jgi:hypothetical protein
MSLRRVLDVYLYIIVFPLVRGFPAYLHTCTCMWRLASEEYYVAYSSHMLPIVIHKLQLGRNSALNDIMLLRFW